MTGKSQPLTVDCLMDDLIKYSVLCVHASVLQCCIVNAARSIVFVFIGQFGQPACINLQSIYIVFQETKSLN